LSIIFYYFLKINVININISWHQTDIFIVGGLWNKRIIVMLDQVQHKGLSLFLVEKEGEKMSKREE